MNRFKLVLFILICAVSKVAGQAGAVQGLQNDIQKTIRKVYATTVKITDYDSVRKVEMSLPFSGVVVSADGFILTAAHACDPGQAYRVVFPDGKTYVAIGRGKITGIDAAVMKITSTGNWPYAEMGWSSSLVQGQPCLSISHPYGIDLKIQPMIRYGIIADPRVLNGKIRSTCLMEPGDSGGPVFDLFGRVIGIHSSIQRSLDDNFEVAIDGFRRNWTALKVAKAYTKSDLPPEEAVGVDPLSAKLAKYKPASFSGKPGKTDGTCFNVSSILKDSLQKAYATLVSLKQLLPDSLTYSQNFFISKSSIVGANPAVQIFDSLVHATVVFRDINSDLVLLKVAGYGDRKLKHGLALQSRNGDSIGFAKLGQLLYAPAPDQQGKLSVLGSRQFDLKEMPNSGFLGLTYEDAKGGISVKTIARNSPASKSELHVGDVILSISGTGFSGSLEFASVISRYKPGDTVQIKVIRADKTSTVSIALAERPTAGQHIANYFEGGKSIRRDNFKGVFAHDGRIFPEECGGPVFDFEGRFMGINIARVCRTSTIAIPGAGIKEFVSRAIASSAGSLNPGMDRNLKRN